MAAVALAHPNPVALDHVRESTHTAAVPEEMRLMFPDVEADVLAAVLAYHGGNIERAVLALLDESSAHEDESAGETDASLARRIQQEQDEEMAKAVQESLEA